METISLSVAQIIYRNPDSKWIVLVCDGCKFKVVGIETALRIMPGMQYEFQGEFGTHDKHGEQFKFRRYSPVRSFSREGIMSTLKTVNGIGNATAAKVWGAFGAETYKVIENDLDALASVVGEKLACQIRVELTGSEADNRLHGEVLAIIDGLGFGDSVARAIIDTLGPDADKSIRANPWLMLEKKIPRAGWNRVDELRRRLGLPSNSIDRQTWYAWYWIGQNQGDTWHSLGEIEAELRLQIGGACDIETAINNGVTLKILTLDPYDQSRITRTKHANDEANAAKRFVRVASWRSPAKASEVYEHLPIDQFAGPLEGFRVDIAEEFTLGFHWEARRIALIGADAIEDATRDGGEVAEQIRRCVPQEPSLGCQWPNPASRQRAICFRECSNHQSLELSKALASPIAILTGCPGTGKTYATAETIVAILKADKHGVIGVACPTGKAAVRINEVLRKRVAAEGEAFFQNAAGRVSAATTIHRLLSCSRDKFQSDEYVFAHNHKDPLPFDYLVVDESSMIPTGLMSALIDAVSPGTHVLFVGDPNQLAPVGHGAPFRDVIECGFATRGHLTEIQRNAGAIVKACHAIANGQPFEQHRTDLHRSLTGDFERVWNRIEAGSEQGANWTHVEIKQADNAAKAVVSLAVSLSKCGPNDIDYNSENLCILTATNNTNELSRKQLNAQLQSELNFGAEVHERHQYRLGDPVICLKNTMSDDEFDPLCNGEIGLVRAIDPEGEILLQFQNPSRTRTISPTDPEDFGNFDIAYAITGHKSQGSEWPIVIVAIDDSYGGRTVCCREWIYTCLSRAKEHVFTVGKMFTLKEMVKRVALPNRRTLLKERIRDEYQTLREERLGQCRAEENARREIYGENGDAGDRRRNRVEADPGEGH